MLLIVYNQQEYVADAIAGALAQDYPNLEIVISDDASTDQSFAIVERCTRDYRGAHRLIVNRNPANLGIGGNISRAVRLSSGELLFIAAGDDVSRPERVSTVVRHWQQHDRRPELIASYLYDMSQDGTILGEIRVADLAAYRSLRDWVRSPPRVIGAAQAWTRRLFDRFGGIPSGVVGEDMLMAFRAIASGGAVTLPVALVDYRRGGVTTKRTLLSAAEVIHGLTRKLASSKTELSSMLAEARQLGADAEVLADLQRRYDKECFVEDMFAAESVRVKAGIALRGYGQTAGFRIRIFVYAAMPWLLAPFFSLKRLRHRRRSSRNA
jgi:glycosyltransferase involved in cell wall biosynthesis